MIPSVFFSRLKTLILAVEISAGVTLFGQDVKVVKGYEPVMVHRLRFPSALIKVGNFVNDREHPQIGIQNFSIIILINNRMDVYGENIFTGSSSGATVTVGMHDASRKVQEAITGIQSLTGSINIQEGDSGLVKLYRSNMNIAFREFKCEVLLEAH